MTTVTESGSNGPITAPAESENSDTLVQQAIDKLRSLQEVIRQRDQEIADLRKEFKQVKFERDIYMRSLYLIDAKNTQPITEEEIREMDKNGLELGQFVEELRQRWKE
jgi:hypothetical protein